MLWWFRKELAYLKERKKGEREKAQEKTIRSLHWCREHNLRSMLTVLEIPMFTSVLILLYLSYIVPANNKVL